MIMLGAQFCGTLLWWIGIFLLAERANISAFQKRFVQITSAMLFIAWFAATPLLAKNEKGNSALTLFFVASRAATFSDHLYRSNDQVRRDREDVSTHPRCW